MSAANTKAERLPSHAEATLYEVRDILRLAAFAAEAKRVLEDISRVRRNRPEVDAALIEGVDCVNDWTMHDFNAAQVLATAATRISALLEAAQ